jgi:hypothetical protein
MDGKERRHFIVGLELRSMDRFLRVGQGGLDWRGSLDEMASEQ